MTSHRTFRSLRYKEVPWLEELLDEAPADWRVIALRGCTPPGVSFVTAMAFITTVCFRTKRPAPWERHPNVRMPLQEYTALRKQLQVPYAPQEADDAFPRPSRVYAKPLPTHAQRPRIQVRAQQR